MRWKLLSCQGFLLLIIKLSNSYVNILFSHERQFEHFPCLSNPEFFFCMSWKTNCVIPCLIMNILWQAIRNAAKAIHSEETCVQGVHHVQEFESGKLQNSNYGSFTYAWWMMCDRWQAHISLISKDGVTWWHGAQSTSCFRGEKHLSFSGYSGWVAAAQHR
jgi:hypothetical protein